jgi:hypothetical protein
MCELASDDARIQASVKQIGKLLTVLRLDLGTRANHSVPHLMVNYNHSSHLLRLLM